MAYKEDLDVDGEKDLTPEPRNAIQASSSCGGRRRKWNKNVCMRISEIIRDIFMKISKNVYFDRLNPK